MDNTSMFTIAILLFYKNQGEVYYDPGLGSQSGQ